MPKTESMGPQKGAPYRILMYSHDTYGLGHIRRTMAIAGQLKREDVNILIVTGSPIVGRFDFPERIDFVRIPGMIKKANDLYLPHSIKIDAGEALTIRQGIIKATAKAFRPHLFIVDKAPLGLKREIVPTLKWLRGRVDPYCTTVLGLRDIMDDAASTRKDWRSKRIYDALEKYYSEIWVYGHREMYDPITEYNIPQAVSERMVFTGYIPRKPLTAKNGNGGVSETSCGSPLILLTTGGGGDGYPLLDAYLGMLEQWGSKPPFRTVIVTGPFMPTSLRQDVARRAKAVGVKYFNFYRRMEQLMASADLVVSMGGYNTVCEILTYLKVSLIVPRETPRLEQRIRAEVLQRQSLADYLGWDQLSPENLRAKVEGLLADPQPYKNGVNNFSLTALNVLNHRLEAFRKLT